AADDGGLEVEARAFAEGHVEGHAAELAADVEQVETEGSARLDFDQMVMDRDRIVAILLQQMLRSIFTRTDDDARGRRHRPHGGERVDVAVAPVFQLAGGEGEAVHSFSPFGLSEVEASD